MLMAGVSADRFALTDSPTLSTQLSTVPSMGQSQVPKRTSSPVSLEKWLKEYVRRRAPRSTDEDGWTAKETILMGYGRCVGRWRGVDEDMKEVACRVVDVVYGGEQEAIVDVEGRLGSELGPCFSL